MKWGQDEPPFLSVCKGWEREQKPAFRCGIGSHSQSFRRQSFQHHSLQLPFLFWSILRSLCSPLPHSPQSPFPYIALLCSSLSRSQLHICDHRVEDLCFEGLETCYLLDFIPPKEFLSDLSRKSKCKIIGFDHRKLVLRHIPPANDCPDNIMINVNLEKSSSSAVYEYFASKCEDVNNSYGAAPCLVESKYKGQVQLMLKYIENGDLRRWSLPGIRVFNIGLSEWRSSYHVFAEFALFFEKSSWQLLELSAEGLIAKGNSCVSARQNAANKLLEKVFRVRLGRGFYGECLGVRADGNSNLSDEIGKLLSVKSAATGLRPIGAVIFMQRNNLKMCLRSTDSSTDTSEVAKGYGGGGSPSSSSFIIRMDEYNQWISGNSS
ncbi:hypothetical protein HKD37_07G019753 [Glycine soja]